MPAKYREYVSEPGASRKDRQQIHPIWRGVGFALIVLIPIISYAATDVLLKQSWFPIPVDLIAQPGQILYRIFPDPMINIKVMLFIALIFVLYTLFTLFSFLITSIFGVSQRKDPYYVPPVQRRSRRRY